jgi:hypothetical protein
VSAKEKNCSAEMKAKGAGDIWTWVALDPDSKLVPCWFHRSTARWMRVSFSGRFERPLGESRSANDGRTQSVF